MRERRSIWILGLLAFSLVGCGQRAFETLAFGVFLAVYGALVTLTTLFGSAYAAHGLLKGEPRSPWLLGVAGLLALASSILTVAAMTDRFAFTREHAWLFAGVNASWFALAIAFVTYRLSRPVKGEPLRRGVLEDTFSPPPALTGVRVAATVLPAALALLLGAWLVWSRLPPAVSPVAPPKATAR